MVKMSGVTQHVREVATGLEFTPNVSVTTVKIDEYFYVHKATESVAKIFCLDNDSLKKAIKNDYDSVWYLTSPELFTDPPSTVVIGKRRGTVIYTKTNMSPKMKLSHVENKFFHKYQTVQKARSRVYKGHT
jgi:hypothetical protein